MNPLRELEASGQAVWFDYIRRSLMMGGHLQRMVDQDGLRGVTANPSIFEKAITGSTDYTDALERLARDDSLDAQAIYERLAIDDVQRAADIMAGVYETSARQDGYVSLEVSPALAHDVEGTCAEARRLWQALARPNVMIKVPATEAGVSAVETLISEGINVECDADLLALGVRPGGPGVPGWSAEAPRSRAASRIGGERGEFLHQPH